MRIRWGSRPGCAGALAVMLALGHAVSACDSSDGGGSGRDAGADRTSPGGQSGGGTGGMNGGGTAGGGRATGGGGQPTAGGSGTGASGGDGGAAGSLEGGLDVDGASGPAGRDAGDASGPGLDGGSGLFEPCAALGIADVRAIAYLPDATGVVLGLGGAVAKLVDPADAHEVRSFVGHTGAVNAVAVSTDGAFLATASDDRTVRLWRISDGKPLGTFSGHGRELLSVAVSPDGARIAAGAADGEVFLWTRSTGKLVATVTDHVDEVRGIGFAAGGARLFTGSKDGSLRVWSAADLSLLATPIAAGSPLKALAVSADGARVAVGDGQGALTFFHAADAARERQVQTSPFGLTHLAFAPDGTRVYGVTSGTSVYAYPVDGSPSTSLLSPIGATGVIAASPDGKALFEATDWALWLTDPKGQSLRDPVQEGPFAHGLAFYPDGSRLAVGGSFGLVVRSLPSGSITDTPDWGQFAATYDGVAVSPDGALVATAEGSGHVRLLSTSTWTTVKDVVTASIRAGRVAFSPDGKLLSAAGSVGLDEVYRVPSGDYVTFLGYSDYVHSTIFSPDGTLVAVGTEDRKLGIVNTSDFSDARRIDDAHSPTVADLAFSNDGALVVSTGDDRVTAWHVTGSTVRNDLFTAPGFGGSTVAISPDGALLVAGGNDGELRLWSVPDFSALPGLPAHGPGVQFARFAPDGRRLAAAYSDGTVWLWCRR